MALPATGEHRMEGVEPKAIKVVPQQCCMYSMLELCCHLALLLHTLVLATGSDLIMFDTFMVY